MLLHLTACMCMCMCENVAIINNIHEFAYFVCMSCTGKHLIFVLALAECKIIVPRIISNYR